MSSYVFGRAVKMDFDAAVQAATAALATQGFGVLSDIDVKATLKKKLDKDIPPYRILGACNPGFAIQAITAEPQIGALLPCNVVVRQDAAGTVYVEAMDPLSVMALVNKPEVEGIAQQVRGKLQAALDQLA